MPRKEVATVALWTPDGQLIMQRRPETTLQYPKHLGLFGGGIEKGELPKSAAIRELSEEIPAAIGCGVLHLIDVIEVEDRVGNAHYEEPIDLYLFDSERPLKVSELVALEGSLEVHRPNWLAARQDLTPAARASLVHLH